MTAPTIPTPDNNRASSRNKNKTSNIMLRTRHNGDIAAGRTGPPRIEPAVSASSSR
jgi:hypothetical protein